MVNSSVDLINWKRSWEAVKRMYEGVVINKESMNCRHSFIHTATKTRYYSKYYNSYCIGIGSHQACRRLKFEGRRVERRFWWSINPSIHPSIHPSINQRFPSGRLEPNPEYGMDIMYFLLVPTNGTEEKKGTNNSNNNEMKWNWRKETESKWR